MYLSEYKDIFGKPREGVRSIRILDIAVIDVIFVIIVSLSISYYMRYNHLLTFVIIFLLGIFFHWLFGVETTVMKYIGM
jgi:hypothetical protein